MAVRVRRLLLQVLVMLTPWLGLSPECVAQQAPPSPTSAEGPTAGPGTVRGIVIDRVSGDPIIEAGVEVVGRPGRVLTNVEGQYSIELPAGTYQLRFFAPLYQGVRLTDVTVKGGQVTRADAVLQPVGEAGMEVVEVVAPARKAAETAQLAQRKAATVVSDNISRETLQKTTGSEAGDVVQRAPAVTVRDEKFVFVRGLGERYTSSLLNDSRLPSPDPLRKAVPLDLFPADFLDSIGIVKTFSPELPGDFSGGLVKLDLRDFPDRLSYSLGISTGGNTQTTFRDFLTYRGSPRDYIALGRAFRNPPSILPPFNVNELPVGERFEVARSFKNIWSPQIAEAPPNFDARFSIGNDFGPFGFQLAALYATEWNTVRDEILRQFGQAATPEDPTAVAVTEDFRVDSSVFQAKLGGILTAAYEPTERHRLALRSFTYQRSVDTTERERGFLESDPGIPFRFQSLEYIQENLSYLQLAGEHKWTDWLLTDWRTALSQTTRFEPDTRFTSFQFDSNLRSFVLLASDPGVFRFTNATRERLTDTRGDFTIPFETWSPFAGIWRGLPAKFKFGPVYDFRDREFSQRRFRYTTTANVDSTQPPEVVFAPNNLIQSVVDFTEDTLPSDAFQASQRISGGYGLFELPIVRDRLRVVGGVRVESSKIQLNTNIRTENQPTLESLCSGPVREGQCPVLLSLKNVNPLPGVNVIVSPIDNMNLRLSYGQSVARPEFRELAPARFPVLPGERATIGNPELVQTEITSYDARWEWFFSPLELVSLSFFYKKLTAPIEPVVVLTSNEILNTFVNGGDAELIGFEFEGRKDFGFIHERLQPLSILANVTYADSTVEIPRQRISALGDTFTGQTSTSRRLVGQSPFIVNGALEYNKPDWFTARLLYYTVGRTLDAAGANRAPDIFLDRRDQLDAVVIVPLARWIGLPISARFTAENILNAPYVFTQGGLTQNRLTTGVKLTLGFTYTQ